MINKIRRTLVFKFTLIIALFLISIFILLTMQNVNLLYKTIDDTLSDYLKEEIHEAHDFFSSQTSSSLNQQSSDSSAGGLLSLRYKDEILIHAELPKNSETAEHLLAQINRLNLKNDTVYALNISPDRYFRILGKTFPNGERIIVASDISFLNKNIRHNFRTFSVIVVLLIVVSFLLGNYFSSRAVRQINEMFERQKRFVADASHELRTPLSIMLAYTELLEYHKDRPEILQKLKEEINALSALISKLLQIARADSDLIRPDKQVFDFTELLQSCVENFSLLAREKNIKIKTSIHGKNKINADINLIRQLLYILLDNAVKYGKNGSDILIKVKQNRFRFSLEIKDHGIGIRPQDQKHIFERFYRADKARSHHNGGTGLGLSMAEIIVSLHHGNIRVKSTPGKETAFTVTLPC